MSPNAEGVCWSCGARLTASHYQREGECQACRKQTHVCRNIELSEDGAAVADVTEMTLPEDMESGRFQSVVLGPDGSLYAAVDEGMIHKLIP